MTIGMFEGISAAIGQADNEIAGLIQTRLTAAVQPKTALAAVFTWNGTTIISAPNTSEVVVGDWISLDADGQAFQIIDVIPNTSIEIDNPNGYDIPTGATPSSKATRSLPVESALDWEEAGKVGIGGVVYRYGSRTDTSLDEVTHLRGGVTTAGVKFIHHIESTVIDLNRNKSAIDLVRRAMLVAYAEGEDLNALGRNLGVFRYPFLASDEIFRDIVQALAYNPKGTVFGLELALDALVGKGNYEIYEDLITYPCTVFVKLLGAAVTDAISAGKTYISGSELRPPTSDTTFQILEDVVARGTIGSVTWKDENLLTSSRLNYPTAHNISEYPGDTPHAAWALLGTGVSEGVDITLAGGATEFTNPAPTDISMYRRKLRLQTESEGFFGALITVPTGAAVDPAIVTGMVIDDGAETAIVGVQADTAGTFLVGFVDSFGNFVTGGTQLTRDTYYDVTVRKVGQDHWELFIHGSLAETVAYSGVMNSTFGNHSFDIGHLAVAASSNQMRLKELAVWTHTHTDFWTARGTGSVNVANPTRLTAGSPIFAVGDVGKLVEVLNSGIVNTYYGNNNGRYFISSYVDGSNVELQGANEENATLQAAFPDRIVIPTTGRQFYFPDDLGKEIVISGSTLGNNDVYIIKELLQAGTFVNLRTGFDTPIPEYTNVCEVIKKSDLLAPSFVTEAGLMWQVNPIFATEALDWELSDAGSWVGTNATLRQALPLSSSDCYRVLSVIYSNVLSAQLLENSLIENEWDPLNLLFSYYPFYIADPLGFVRTYLDGITAAGVIPDFLLD